MGKKQSGLGRDFYSLFDDNMVGESKKSAAEMLRISDVEPRVDQPRKNANLSNNWLIPSAHTAFFSRLLCVRAPR